MMKNSILNQIKGNTLFYVSAVFLLILVFIDPFNSNLTSYLKDQIESITLSLGLMIELKTIAWVASNSHLPVVAGISASTLETLTTAIKYLSWSDVLVTSQLLLLAMSKSLILKVSLILSLLGSLTAKFRTVSLKYLVIVLLINPGLPAYISCVKYVAQEAQLNSGDELSQELQMAHLSYQKEEKGQKANTPVKSKKDTNFIKEIEDKAKKDITQVAKKVEEGVSKEYLELKESTKEIKIKTINLFSSILIQFILLPFLFFYGLFLLFKRILSVNTTDAYLGNTVKIQALALLVIGTLSSFTEEKTRPEQIPQTDKISSPIPKTKAHVKDNSALGIDVSHFQGEINWVEIKAHDIIFAYTKATEGQSFMDPKFQKNWSDMLQAEITRGAYHFYSSDVRGEAQALHFIHTLGDLKQGDLPPALDLENRSIIGEVEVEAFQNEVKIWLKTVEEKFGLKPIIYTNNPFANEYLNHPDFAEYLLWVAEYGVEEPKTPVAWKGKGWAIWQRTERGSIEGKIGNVDHDTSQVFLGGIVLK